MIVRCKIHGLHVLAFECPECAMERIMREQDREHANRLLIIRAKAAVREWRSSRDVWGAMQKLAQAADYVEKCDRAEFERMGIISERSEPYEDAEKRENAQT